jgi:hypothetical protein
MSKQQATLIITRLSIRAQSIEVEFESNLVGLRHTTPLFVQYPHPIDISEREARHVVLAAFLPYALRFGATDIRWPLKEDQSADSYWRGYIARFGDLSSQSFSTQHDSNCLFELSRSAGGEPLSSVEPHSVALLFGGGVESLFALMRLKDTQPLLVSLAGPRFMNNDEDGNRVKLDLERRLLVEHGFKVNRVVTNVRDLFLSRDDSIFNRYETGAWFYHFLRPLLMSCGVQLLLKSAEFEEANLDINYDTSLHARVVPEIADGLPVFSPVFNGYSKAEMFLKLSSSPFFDFVFSCHQPGEGRWCGKCSKCGRIAEYGRRFGVDVRRIGLNDIPYRVNGKVEALYASSMDRLQTELVANSSPKPHAGLTSIPLGQRLKFAWLSSVLDAVDAQQPHTAWPIEVNAPAWLDYNLENGIIHEHDFRSFMNFILHFDVETVIDVGASYGYSATTLRNLGFLGRIFSIEPLAVHIPALQHLMAKWPDSFQFASIAILDSTRQCLLAAPCFGKQTFVDYAFDCNYEPNFDSIAQSLSVAQSEGEEVSAVRFSYQSLRGETLDNLLGLGHWATSGARIALKIDTNGTEMAVLRGAQSILRDRKALVFVSGPVGDGRLRSFMSDMDYIESSDASFSGVVNETTLVYNSIFVPRDWF